MNTPVSIRPARTTAGRLSVALAAAVLTTSIAASVPARPSSSVVDWLYRSHALQELSDEKVVSQLTRRGQQEAGVYVGLVLGRIDIGETRVNVSRVDRLLLDALAELPSERVVDEVVRATRADVELGEKLVAARLLGRVANKRALDGLLEIFANVDVVHFRRPYVRSALEGALERIFANDERAFRAVVEAISDQPNELISVTIRAAARAGGPEMLKLFSDLAGPLDTVSATILEELRVLDIRDRAKHGARASEIASRFLTHPDPELRRRAVSALGSLAAARVIPDVVDMLSDSERSVGRAAHHALREIARTNWPADAGKWMNWFEREERWLNRKSSELELALAGHDSVAAFQALRDLSAHTLFAQRVSNLMAEGLWHSDPAVVAAAAQALSRLNTPAALPHLIDALSNADEVQRRSIGHSLRGLTGVELANDYRAWSSWLDRTEY